MRSMTTRGPYAKGLAKRDEILDIALELFAQKGYDRTSVREIARRTGLSQAGLLHHFSGKEELFLEVLRRRDDRVTNAEENLHLHPVERLISAVDLNTEEPGLVRLFVAMSAESADPASDARGFFAGRYRWLLEEVARDVRRLQDAGGVAGPLRPEDVASLLVAAADGLQIQWLLDPEGVDMPGRIRALWETLGDRR